MRLCRTKLIFYLLFTSARRIYQTLLEVVTSIDNIINTLLNEPVHEKTNSLGSDQVQQKPGCTVTEDG